jgi:HD-like signal output (HDOD) protein
MAMDPELIVSKLSKIEVLPTFPAMVGEVINVIEDPMSSASDLAKSMDPSMAGEVLRVANTAYFGTGNFRNITSIEHAIAIVGFQHLSHIILHMPFVSMIKGDSVFNREEFIKHSIVCGILSKSISSCTYAANPNEIYIGGLMHDIGAIVIYRYFHEECDKINVLVTQGALGRLDAEREVLSLDHGMIGALLLQLWNIPKTITDGIMYHHNPEAAKENRMPAMMINVGNKFAKKINLRDNFLSFDEFLTEYKGFVQIAQDQGVHLTSGEELKFFEHAFVQLKNAKGFFEGVLEENNDKSPCC